MKNRKNSEVKKVKTYYQVFFPNLHFVVHFISYKTPFLRVSRRFTHAHHVFWNI